MKTITLKSSSAQTESTTGDLVRLSDYGDAQAFRSILLHLDLTAAATQAGDTLDVYVDMCADANNPVWINVVHFTQILGNGGAKEEVAKISSGELNDPDAVLSVASDASAGVVRNVGIMPNIRYRSAITDTSTDDASFTYSLTATLN